MAETAAPGAPCRTQPAVFAAPGEHSKCHLQTPRCCHCRPSGFRVLGGVRHSALRLSSRPAMNDDQTKADERFITVAKPHTQRNPPAPPPASTPAAAAYTGLKPTKRLTGQLCRVKSASGLCGLRRGGMRAWGQSRPTCDQVPCNADCDAAAIGQAQQLPGVHRSDLLQESPVVSGRQRIRHRDRPADDNRKLATEH